MNNLILSNTASMLVAGGKGLLSMDESNISCNKRLAQSGIPQTETIRHNWRELLATTPHLHECISGAILQDETIRQKKKDGVLIIETLMEAGIIPGVKVDTGTHALAGFSGERITEGLDGLRERLTEYAGMGVLFAKWRGEIVIGDGIPSRACIKANAHALARYAALCQEAGLVPILETDVLMDGTHDLQQCSNITTALLRAVFEQLYEQNVRLEGLILKPSMILSGLGSHTQATADEVADATIQCLLQSVPAAVSGIAFLSGAQSGEMAAAHLNAMHVKYKSTLPWPFTFAFARANQQSAMDIWHGMDVNVQASQQALYHRATCAMAANSGKYNAAMEKKRTILS